MLPVETLAQKRPLTDLMRFSKHLPLSAAKENLRRLVAIRAIALLVLMAGVYYAHSYLGAPLRYNLLALLISVMLLVAVFTVFRLRLSWPVTDIEYFVQLALDVIALTLLLYFAGGSTNPFISYYLVLLTISAATLPWRYTWWIAASSIAAYSFLLFFYHPLTPVANAMMMDHVQPKESFFSLHIVGMWLTFVASALLITYFVVKMAQAIRDQGEVLARRRETALHDEQLLAVATLAAGAAHELNTPLSTMAVVIGDLLQEQANNAELLEDLKILESQVQACKYSLQNMVEKSEASTRETGERVAVVTYIHSLLERWQLMRPEVHSQFFLETAGESPYLRVDETMNQAIINLLNNAGDASPQQVDIGLSWDLEKMLLTIRDYGEGIPMAIAEQIGKPFVTTKRKGIGLGLFLSHATVARFKGQVALYNHEQGGTLTELSVPLEKAESC